MNILKVLTQKRVTGNIGEDKAADFLRSCGYKIIKRNYTCPAGEIDIIAENEATLAFIEVKTRTEARISKKEVRPAAAVTPEKQRKIISCAKYFIGKRPPEKRISLDVIEVYLTKDESGADLSRAVHIKNAFNYNTAHERNRKWR